jgi:hypothetical protein
MAKRGRPTVLPGRAMTPAERMRRHRYMRGWVDMMLKRMMRRHPKPAYQHNWNRTGPVDILAYEYAYANFNLETKTADFQRWNEINERVLDQLVFLERDLGRFRNKPTE